MNILNKIKNKETLIRLLITSITLWVTAIILIEALGLVGNTIINWKPSGEKLTISQEMTEIKNEVEEDNNWKSNPILYSLAVMFTMGFLIAISKSAEAETEYEMLIRDVLKKQKEENERNKHKIITQIDE